MSFYFLFLLSGIALAQEVAPTCSVPSLLQTQKGPRNKVTAETDDKIFDWPSALSREFQTSLTNDFVRCSTDGVGPGKVNCWYETGDFWGTEDFSATYDKGGNIVTPAGRTANISVQNEKTIIHWGNDALELKAFSGKTVGPVSKTRRQPLASQSLPDAVQRGDAIPEAAAPGGVLTLFETQVRQRPDSVALLDAETGTTVTYSKLAQSVDSLAAALKQVGICQGDVVGLLLQPSCAHVIATLAVMKAGACWLPLDAKSPGPRLQKLLQRAGACMVLAEKTVESIDPLPTGILSASGALSSSPTALVKPAADAVPADVAAIFYTSGSSGEPKAVMYGHDTICHGALTFGKLCQVDGSSVILLKTPTIWAVTEYEVFTPLIFGARAIVSAESQRDVAKLAQTISNYEVSVLVTSAPVLQLLTDEKLPWLRQVVNVGAALPLEVCKVVQKSWPSTSIHNLYGCTETPCLQWTYDSSSSPEEDLAPAGLPQPGAEVQILDEDLDPVPPGELGEVFIGGPYLSRGYLGDQSLTKKRFIVKGTGTGTLYRTGDAGRWIQAASGPVLQIEGRVDRQMNINGIRVSPEEIEAVILQASGVKEVAVVAANDVIVACILGSERSVVEQHAKKNLPSHMQPSLLMLDTLPKLGNGKVDLVSLGRLAETFTDQDSDVEVTDSLGRMRKVKQDMASEMMVASSARGWASLNILIYHQLAIPFSSVWCLAAIDMRKDLWMMQGTYDLRILLVGLFSLRWEMPMFAAASAYLDSRQAPRTKWMENAMAITVCAMVEIHSDDWLVWYMKFYLAFNVLHTCVFLPMRENVPQRYMNIVKVAIVILVVRLSTLLHFINLCPPGADTTSEHEGWCVLFPKTSTTFADFGLDSESYLFSVYAVTWWFGPDLALKARSLYPKMPVKSPWPLMAMLFCVAWWIGDPSHRKVRDENLYLDVLIRLVFMLLTVVVIALGQASTYFPTQALNYLGTCALGTYLVQQYADPELFDRVGLPHATDIYLPGYMLPKLVAMYLYAVLYAVTLGNLFQTFVLDGIMYLFSKTNRAGRALWANMNFKDQELLAVAAAHGKWQRLCQACFNKGGLLCIDGGTGSEVQREAEKLGPDAAVNSEGWSCVQWKTHPKVLQAVHMSYYRSGAKLVISNSYATNRHIMKAAGFEDLTVEATQKSVRLACQAREVITQDSGEGSIPDVVAGSMSCHPPGMSHGANMDDGKWPEPEIEQAGYLEQAVLLRDGGADVIFVEMVWEWKKHGSKAASAANASGMPVVICFAVFDEKSCQDEMPQLHDGTLLEDIAKEITGEGWDNVVGLCVHHTKLPLVLPCLMAFRRGGWKGVIGAYPDHGTFEMPHWRFEPLEADRIVDYMSEWVDKANCQMVGGCCGIGPETIEKVSKWCGTFNACKGIKDHRCKGKTCC